MRKLARGLEDKGGNSKLDEQFSCQGERIDESTAKRLPHHPESGTILLRHGCGAAVRLCPGKKTGTLSGSWSCGNGIIPILMEAKTEGKHFTGLEIQPESADMARRSVALNGLQDRIDIVEGDIKDASKIFGASSFHVVTTNPPYMTAQHGLTNLYEAKTIARHEVLCNLEDIIRESARLLMPGGRFYMVHRPFRLAEIISLMVQYRMEPKRMRLVYPYVDREPNMVLIEGLRGGKSRMTVEKPLIVYKEPGKYTDEIYDVYGY